MRLYSGLSEQFVQAAARNQIAGKLEDAFFRQYRYRPSKNEVRSWQNSLRAMADVFRHAELTDHGVLLEYQLPLTSRRLDCMACGRDSEGADQAVIVELKQWDECEETEADNLVLTWVGGGRREVLHPSAQVDGYRQYLADTHTAFHEGGSPVGLASCAYLHNYAPAHDDPLFSTKFSDLLASSPTYTIDDFEPLAGFLSERLSAGMGQSVLKRVEESEYRPSKKLMEHVAGMIAGNSDFVLLDEQRVVYEKVLAWARRGFDDRRKRVLLVRGGPGTGKSVVAINLMGDLLRMGLNAQYATGSKSFTGTLRKVVGPRGSVQFKYFNSYGDALINEIDVLVCDEAHRIREHSWSRFIPKSDRSDKLQIQELIDAAKVSVFFIDDRQVVRPDEIGSSKLVRETAEASQCQIFEHKLEAQFRCAGSDGFVNWVDNTLEIERTANVLWDTAEEFDFRIFDSPQALDRAIRGQAAKGHSARLTAGFCWPWAKKPNPDRSLVEDVVIGDFRRPWNAHYEATRLAKGIPKADLWAYEPGGLEQVGCVYTAQGFEFDYVGVIFGLDLRYGFDGQAWLADREHSEDVVVKRSKDKFLELVKNTYRVLLSRGLKGCYVYFQDPDTEKFVRSRMEHWAGTEMPEAVEEGQRELEELKPEESLLPFRIVPPAEVKPYQNAVPCFDLEVAAGALSESQDPGELSDATWVEPPEDIKPALGQFIARVMGESMNRRIPNGSWCLFKKPAAGTRNGKVVLAQHRSIEDPEHGGQYTVKIYESEKRQGEAGWEHSKIVLRPASADARFKPIVVLADEDFLIVGELVAVLG